VIPAEVPLAHLVALTDEHGIFEHANGDVPAREHGFCLDDAARALIVTVREDAGSSAAARLADVYLQFVDDAIGRDGRARNRMDAAGRWTDGYDVGDWWGRAVWGLGVAATTSSRPEFRARATSVFRRAAQASAPYLRTMCFAAVGASDILAADPRDSDARRLLERAIGLVTTPRSALWEWPQDRLRYGNGVIPEAHIAGGAALQDDGLIERGLALLEFLLSVERNDGHLSVTPTRGRGPGDLPPAFDQQPIEVSSIAEACTRAFEVTGDPRWIEPVELAWAWFEGRNDVGIAMFDPRTGAGYDGLKADGRNENRGAESTLAALSTLQCVRRCRMATGTEALVSASAHTRSGDGGRSSSLSDAASEP
jgi:hypothetical protein